MAYRPDTSLIYSADKVDPRAEQLRDLQLRQAQMANDEAVRKQEADRRNVQLRELVGGLASKGDYAGGRKAALEAGDMDLYDQIGKIDQSQRDMVALRAKTAGGIAIAASQLPPEQRIAYVSSPRVMQQLQAAGWTPDDVSKTDWSDAGIQALIAESRSAEDALKAYDKQNEGYTLNQGDRRFVGGKMIAENPAKPDYLKLGEGEVAFPISGASPAGSASPATNGAFGPQIEQSVASFIPGVTVTSRQRDPAKNAAVGGVPNSFHKTDNARDFVPPRGMSTAQLTSALKQRLPGFDVIDEQDHVHVEPGPNMASAPASSGVLRGNPKSQQPKAPSGYRWTANGSLEPIPGGPGDKQSPQGTKQQQGVARAKMFSLNAIEAQMRRVETAMSDMEKNGYSGFLQGRIPGTLDASSNRFDKAVAALAPLIRQLTRVPGEGAMTDYESRLAQATLPDRVDTPEGRREALASIRELVRQTKIGYQKFLGNTPANPALSKGGPARIKGDADYAKLPSGAQFIGPDGKLRRKP